MEIIVGLVLAAYAVYRLVKAGYISVKVPVGTTLAARAVTFVKSVF